MRFFYRVRFSIGISTLQHLEGFFISSSDLFEDRLQCLSLRCPCLPRRERVRGLRDEREVGTVLDLGGMLEYFCDY